MVIAPVHCRGSSLETEDEEREVRALELAIDPILRTHYCGAPVRIPLEYNPDRHVLMEMIRRYRVAGWLVKVQSFDPASLVFS